MKIYYNMPECDSEKESKILYLLYENFKLNMMWKLRHIEFLMKKENGCIFIDRTKDEEDNEQLQLRFEGFSENLITIMQGLLSDKVKLSH